MGGSITQLFGSELKEGEILRAGEEHGGHGGKRRDTEEELRIILPPCPSSSLRVSPRSSSLHS
jgi:hypothetical protein